MNILDRILAGLLYTKKYSFSHYGYIQQTPPNGNGDNGDNGYIPPSGSGNGYQSIMDYPETEVTITSPLEVVTSPSKETISAGQEPLDSAKDAFIGDPVMDLSKSYPSLFDKFGFSGSKGRSAYMRAMHPPKGGKGGLI